MFICHFLSNLQILNSFEKLRSFWIQICKAFFSKPPFRGRAFDLKFCIIPKENRLIQVLFLFSVKVLAFYCEREITLNLCVLLWDYAKIAQILEQMCDPTLKQGITDKQISSYNAKWSQLFKSVRNLKIGHTLARHIIQKRTL